LVGLTSTNPKGVGRVHRPLGPTPAMAAGANRKFDEVEMKSTEGVWKGGETCSPPFLLG
jgi:hypothetical protein